jgi:NTE family protein
VAPDGIRLAAPSDQGDALRGNVLRKSVCVLASLLVLIETRSAFGQERPSRTRVGLALGGGSARGLAHVGVLRWLEEHRVPVDAIAGTSTGAFIGGAYATGMSAADIQSMLLGVDWDLMLRPGLPYELKSYRRKEDDLELPINVELGLRDGFRFQSGLNSGHRMGLLLSRLAFPYSRTASFDDLAIPFRCVATDLEAGEVVILDRGPLGVAMRASMSLPGTFDPVLRDGRQLADGGILNNVPVDVAREMGVDVVIAVNVSTPRRTPRSDSIQAVANRAIRLMMHNLDLPRLAQADVVITPDLEGIRADDFEDSEAIAARGYEAAEAQSSALLRYAVGEEAWRLYRDEKKQRRRPVMGGLTFVEALGVPQATAAQISRRMEHDLLGVTDPTPIDAHLDWVIGHGRYASGMYQRVERDGKEGLAVQFKDKSYAPPLVKFAFNLDNENKDFNLSLGSRVTFMDVTSLGSELRVDTSFGARLRVAAELFQPVGGRGSMRSGAFLAPRAFYTRAVQNVYQDEELAAVLNRRRAGAGLDIGWLFGARAQIRAGYEAAKAWNATRVGVMPSVAGVEDGQERAMHIQLDYEGQDRAYFPTRGVRLRSRSTWWREAPGFSDRFGRGEGALNLTFTPREGHHLSFHAEGAAMFGGLSPTLYQPALGGPFRLGALAPNSMRASRMLIGGFGYRRELGKLPTLLGDRMYVTGLIEAGSAFDKIGDARLQSGFTAGLAADTVIGPFFIGASIGEHSRFRAYFLVGAVVR